jgi:hypothetical protein
MHAAEQTEFFFIDTSVRGTVRLGRIPSHGQRRIAIRSFEGRQNIVSCAERFFGPHLSCACGMIVVAGPGSFSAIRSGVLVANLFSRLLHLPLYQVMADEAGDLDAVRDRILSKKLTPVSYVAPVYDAEPNITLKVVQS